MRHNDENLERIRKIIEEEKRAAREQFDREEFGSGLKTRLRASEEEEAAPQRRPPQPRPRFRSAWAFFRSRPLAAGALGAALISLGAALWFLMLAPSLRRPAGTLEKHILQVLLQSSLSEQETAEPGASSVIENFSPLPRVSDPEIPLILYKILENLMPGRAPRDIEEEPEAPADHNSNIETKEKNRFFYEILKRIKEV